MISQCLRCNQVNCLNVRRYSRSTSSALSPSRLVSMAPSSRHAFTPPLRLLVRPPPGRYFSRACGSKTTNTVGVQATNSLKRVSGGEFSTADGHTISIPGLNALELEFIQSQTEEILSTRLLRSDESAEVAKELVSRHLPFLSIQQLDKFRILQSELLTRRCIKLMETLNLQNDAEKSRLFQNVALQYEKNPTNSTLSNILHRSLYDQTASSNEIRNTDKERDYSWNDVIAAASNLGVELEPLPGDARVTDRQAIKYIGDQLFTLSDKENRSKIGQMRFPNNQVPDPLDFLRKFYLVHQMVQADFTPGVVRNLRKLHSWSSLAFLIHLNLLNRTVMPGLNQTTRTEAILSGLKKNIGNITSPNYIQDELPVSLWHQILIDLGYSHQAVVDILLDNNEQGLCEGFLTALRLHQPASIEPEAEPLARLKPRQKFVSKYAKYLGQMEGSNMLKIVMLWPNVLATLESKLPEMKVNQAGRKTLRPQIRTRLLQNSGPAVSVRQVPTTRLHSSFLVKLLKIKSSSVMNEKKLRERLQRVPSYRDVDHNLVVFNFNLLQAAGFSLEQIQHGMEILFYPTKYIQEALLQMSEEMGGHAMVNDKNAISILAFNIERDSGFTCDRVREGLLENGHICIATFVDEMSKVDLRPGDVHEDSLLAGQTIHEEEEEDDVDLFSVNDPDEIHCTSDPLARDWHSRQPGSPVGVSRDHWAQQTSTINAYPRSIHGSNQSSFTGPGHKPARWAWAGLATSATLSQTKYPGWTEENLGKQIHTTTKNP